MGFHEGGTITRRLLEDCCQACLAGAPDVAAAPSSRVDRRRGVIRGVKVLSQKSRNGRRYTIECLKRAVPLYEGVSVRINHPDDKDQGADRKVDDVLGRLRKVRLGPGGIYADLEYLQSHPVAPRICEAAERMPKAYGLSHNVSDWDGHYEDGDYVVTEIREVESVDLVADPATTSGLFEGRAKRRKTSRKGKTIKLLEWSRKQKAPLRRAFRSVRESLSPAARRLLEEAAMPGALLADGADPEAAIKSAFRAAMNGILDDNGSDMKTKLARMKEVLAAEEKLMASGAVTPTAIDDASEGDELADGYDGGDDDPDGSLMEDDEDLDQDDDEEGDEEGDEEEPVRESRRATALAAELAQTKRELAVRRLCEAERVQPAPPILKALLALDNEDDRRALLRESRKRNAPAARGEKPFIDAITGDPEEDEDDDE